MIRDILREIPAFIATGIACGTFAAAIILIVGG
jgi:hypothetical protein